MTTDYGSGQQNDQIAPEQIQGEDQELSVTERADLAVSVLLASDVRSQEFQDTVSAITSADQDVVDSITEGMSRLLELTTKATSIYEDASSENAQDSAHAALIDAREEVEDLSAPEKENKKGIAKALGWFTRGNRVVKTTDRQYDTSAQNALKGVRDRVKVNKEQLTAENFALEEEKARLRKKAYKLLQRMLLNDQIEHRLITEVEKMRDSGDPRDAEKAIIVEAQAILPIRQRRQDLSTQVSTVILTGRTVDQIQENNKEFGLGLERVASSAADARDAAFRAQQEAESDAIILSAWYDDQRK